MSDGPVHGSNWPQAVQEVIGSTLDAIGRPALRDIYNAALGDRITAWRAGNLATVFREYQKATKDLPPEGRRFVAEKLGVRFVEEASLEDDPALQKIWANLLAAAVNKEKPDVTSRYISVARELNPSEVLFLKTVYDHACKVEEPLSYTVKFRSSPHWSSIEEINDVVIHLLSLGVVRRSEGRLNIGKGLEVTNPNLKHITVLEDLDTVKLTKFGWEFVCASIKGLG